MYGSRPPHKVQIVPMVSKHSPSAQVWHYNSEFMSLRELHLGLQVSSESHPTGHRSTSSMTSPDSADSSRTSFPERVDDSDGESTLEAFKKFRFSQSPYQTPPRASPVTVKSPTSEKFNLTTSPEDSKVKAIENSVSTDSAPDKPGGADEKVANVAQRKVFKGKGWLAAPFIFGGEIGERAGSYGLQLNLINYLLFQMNMPLPTAANMVTNFFGITCLAGLGGAFIADAYVGRFLTMAGGCAFYLVGMLVFTFAASSSSLRPPPCSRKQLHLGQCKQANSFQMGVLYSSLVLQCFGSGGVRPCAAPFGADQFDKTDKKHETQLRHYFNWYYMCLGVAFLMSLTVIVYIEDDISWGWGAGVCSILMGLGFAIFMLGVPFYKCFPPEGSPMTSLVQVMVAALRKQKLVLPANPDHLYKARMYQDKEALAAVDEILIHTDNLRFLDKAAILDEIDELLKTQEIYDPWRLATVHQVEELKILLRMSPIWLCAVIVSTVIVQSGTFAVQQAITLNLRLGPVKIPPASMAVFSVLALMLFVPVYDIFMIKILRKITGHTKGLTYLQRIGSGLLLSMVSMIAAAVVEGKRRNTVYNSGLVDLQPDAILPMSGLWLVPQYVLAGFAESFLMIGVLEFFYDEAPARIRTLSSAFVWSALGVGSFFSSVIVSIIQDVTKKNGQGGWLQSNINRGHLDSFYWLLALLCLVNFIFFLFISQWYVYKNTNLEISLTTSDDDDDISLKKGGQL